MLTPREARNVRRSLEQDKEDTGHGDGQPGGDRRDTGQQNKGGHSGRSLGSWEPAVMKGLFES